MLINHFTQDFRGGVFVKSKEALLICCKHRDDRVVLMQQEIMIKVLVNVGVNTVSNIGKIADHALVVELFLLYGNRGLNAMPV